MELINTTLNWLSLNYQTVGAYAGFGAALSVFAEFIKKQFNLDVKTFQRINRKTIVRLVFTALTALPFVIDQILQTFDIVPQLHANFAWFFVAATWAHWFVLSPTYKKITEKLQENQSVKDDAQAYRALVATQKERAVQPTAARQAATTGTDVYDPTSMIDQ